MQNWLVKRLTPYKSREERWTGLAAAVQQAWENFFDPRLSRLESLRSYYQADQQDLKRLIREMGDYFSEDLPGDKDRPIAVSWRRMELEYKDLELILSSVFRRHFGNLPTTWFPIFAPVDEDYGMTFVPAQGPWPERKNIPPDGTFLTSRGRLGTDFAHLLQMGLPKAEFLEKAIPILKRTKPLHIVYDGPLFYIRFDIPVSLEFDVTLWTRDDWMSLPFSTVGGRFDFIPADKIPVDLSTMSCWWERENDLVIPFKGLPGAVRWHLDWHFPEGFPPDWIPLDSVVAGLDGEESFFRLMFQDHRRYGYEMSLRRALETSSTVVDMYSGIPVLPFDLDATVRASIREHLWHTDSVLCTEGNMHVSTYECSMRHPFFASSFLVSSEKEQIKTPIHSASAADCALSLHDTTVYSALQHVNPEHHLDTFPRFDEIPADFCPLDMPVGGIYA